MTNLPLEKPVPPFLPDKPGGEQQNQGSVLKRILEAQKHIATTPGSTPLETPVSTPPFVGEEQLTEADKEAVQKINEKSTFVKRDESGRAALQRLAEGLKKI